MAYQAFTVGTLSHGSKLLSSVYLNRRESGVYPACWESYCSTRVGWTRGLCTQGLGGYSEGSGVPLLPVPRAGNCQYSGPGLRSTWGPQGPSCCLSARKMVLIPACLSQIEVTLCEPQARGVFYEQQRKKYQCSLPLHLFSPHPILSQTTNPKITHYKAKLQVDTVPQFSCFLPPGKTLQMAGNSRHKVSGADGVFADSCDV